VLVVFTVYVPKNSGLKYVREQGLLRIKEQYCDKRILIKEVRGETIPKIIDDLKNESELVIGITGYDLLENYRTGVKTDFTQLIEKAIEILPRGNETKHLIILTDALPTVGDDPEGETIAAVAKARGAGITLSIVGILLDPQGEKLAKEMTRIGDGRLYLVRNLDQLDKLVLQEYDTIRA